MIDNESIHTAGALRSITLAPIGVAHTEAEHVPRHWTASELEGTLDIDEAFREGLCDIQPGQRIVVLFVFDRSPRFEPRHLRQTPPSRSDRRGVFSICSPLRPNPIGLSVLTVLSIEGTRLTVRGLDMLDGTPILDLKPHVE
jgi:tRNA-Thr(GGU) m(6)t(6)A37 methyltransferase TsaA